MFILIAEKFKVEYVNLIKRTAPESEVKALSRDNFFHLLPQAEVLLIRPRDFTSQVLKEGGKLRWIHSLAAGVDRFLPLIKEQDNIILTNSSGVHQIQVAEHVLSFIFALSRNLPLFFHQQAKATWKLGPVNEVEGKILGILGLGRIGNSLARKAHSLGMRVWGLKYTPGEKPDYVEQLFEQNSIDKLMAGSDFLVILLPLTSATRGLIDRKLLSLMKNTAYLINVARGEIVDETALLEALKEKKIAGAALDVFQQEPLPENSPFYHLLNVIITPHVSGISPQYNSRATEIFCKNLSAYLRNEKLPNLVDMKKGY